MSEQTYAAYWNDGPEGPRYAGRIVLGPAFAELSGGSPDGRRLLRRLFFDEIASVRYEHGFVLVRRRKGAALQIGSVDKPGALLELAQRLQAGVAPI